MPFGGSFDAAAGLLRPADVPAAPLYDAYRAAPPQPLTSATASLLVETGHVEWGHDKRAPATFDVLRRVMRRDEVEQVRALLANASFDAEPDSVDGMASHEMFVDIDDGAGGLGGSSSSAEAVVAAAGRNGMAAAGLKEDYDPATRAARAPLRAALQAILRPVLDERVTPYVRARFPDVCARGGGRDCTPCYSLIRRYRPDERRSHEVHYDQHALVSVVVSLAEHGVEYEGGLYVATGLAEAQRRVIGLGRGDAVVHQYDLLHGVSLRSGERWSWILWYRDSEVCDEHGYEWPQTCARGGNPICQLHMANKVGQVPGISEADVSALTLSYTLGAARGGISGAMYKLGRAYMKKLPSSLPHDVHAAARWFRRAVSASGEPSAAYSLAQMVLEGAIDGGHLEWTGGAAAAASNTTVVGGINLAEAVRLFEVAAMGGHSFAMFNLGVAHLYGFGTPRRSAEVAAEWFEASGLPEGFVYVAMHRESRGKREEAAYWGKRARSAGFGQPWRRKARLLTGVGTAGNVDLHSRWPTLTALDAPPRL